MRKFQIFAGILLVVIIVGMFTLQGGFGALSTTSPQSPQQNVPLDSSNEFKNLKIQ